MSTHHQRLNTDAPKPSADRVFVEQGSEPIEGFRVVRGFFKDLCNLGSRASWIWHEDIRIARRRGVASNG